MFDFSSALIFILGSSMFCSFDFLTLDFSQLKLSLFMRDILAGLGSHGLRQSSRALLADACGIMNNWKQLKLKIREADDDENPARKAFWCEKLYKIGMWKEEKREKWAMNFKHQTAPPESEENI